jgi:hypothetical protein
MKFFTAFVFLSLLGLVIYEYMVIERLGEELAMSKVQNTSYQRKAIRFVKREKGRNRIFSYLYEINKDKKKIKYLPGELIVEDLSLAQNDQFLDLLDYLFEDDQLIMIELPENQEVKKDLKMAGFSNDFLTTSKDGVWKIKIKQ